MSEVRANDERLHILQLWWMLELFSPQTIPKLTRRATRQSDRQATPNRTRGATRPPDRQVIDWKPGSPLPWEELPAPVPVGSTRRVWRHTVYLGVYELEATYESLHRVFGDDTDAYDERPGGKSACAGLLIDQDGQLVSGSAVLSSALWAVARIHNQGPQNSRWMEGFDQALEEFANAVDGYEGDRRDVLDKHPPTYDAESLHELLKIAHASAGISGFDDLATDRVVVESVAVSARRADESADTNFLNSFYLDDLATVSDQVRSGNFGPALAAYLTSDHAIHTRGRVDVITSPDVVDVGTAIDRLPKGRWPAKPEHSLALSQQFAVNQALNDLGPSAGLLGVNGPPGTGKTTMLRDILAGNVVERARRLASLNRPEDAFTEVTHGWTVQDGHPRIVRQLRPELTGFEMVVASANNAAVENVTTEIPAKGAIDERWHDDTDTKTRIKADYFGEIATQVLREAPNDDTSAVNDPPVAWGLIAARLGNKRNRAAFHSAFWFDKKNSRTNELVEDAIPRMQTRLTQWRDGLEPHKSWDQARKDFTTAEQRVDVLVRQRHQAHKRLQQLTQLADREHELIATIQDTVHHLQQVEHDLARHISIEQQAESDQTHAATQHDRHLAAKPSALETTFTFGRAVRDWRAQLEPLAQTLRATEQSKQETTALGQQLRTRLQQTREILSAAEHNLALARDTQIKLRSECAQDKERYGDGYPGDHWTGDHRELHAPWLDAELDTARSELFLAALQLHQDFLANTARDMVSGLRAASEVVAGNYPYRLEAEKLRAAWQLFFLTVPLVSTTFASASRMFGDIGPEAIGWLLIDEAGQASPQYAAGAIWRARRVVAVGDPLQLQPVVTIPQKAQRDIATSYGISPTWLPPKASVQTLADRVATYGTTLNQGEEQVWVSAPLRVHRRCDDPMFTLCNEIAYKGIMVDGVHRDLNNPDKPDLFDSPTAKIIAASHWVDEAANTPGSHLQPTQIDRLEKALAYLKNHDIDPSKVIAISPFRAVADRLASLAASYPGLRAGTIHTAQGREAPVVILVLGGDPNSPGAKAWAASAVNLVNVAASRAQRRLYVIGDRDSWTKHNHFRELGEALE